METQNLQIKTTKIEGVPGITFYNSDESEICGFYIVFDNLRTIFPFNFCGKTERVPMTKADFEAAVTGEEAIWTLGKTGDKMIATCCGGKVVVKLPISYMEGYVTEMKVLGVGGVRYRTVPKGIYHNLHFVILLWRQIEGVGGGGGG